MDYVGLVLKLLDTGLSLWDSVEKNKYVDKRIQLEKDFYEEYNKPLNVRSDAVLDNICFQLRVLSLAFISASAGTQNTPTQ